MLYSLIMIQNLSQAKSKIIISRIAV